MEKLLSPTDWKSDTQNNDKKILNMVRENDTQNVGASSKEVFLNKGIPKFVRKLL